MHDLSMFRQNEKRSGTVTLLTLTRYISGALALFNLGFYLAAAPWLAAR
jgi:hypothetical protein